MKHSIQLYSFRYIHYTVFQYASLNIYLCFFKAILSLSLSVLGWVFLEERKRNFIFINIKCVYKLQAWIYIHYTLYNNKYNKAGKSWRSVFKTYSNHGWFLCQMYVHISALNPDIFCFAFTPHRTVCKWWYSLYCSVCYRVSQFRF